MLISRRLGSIERFFRLAHQVKRTTSAAPVNSTTALLSIEIVSSLVKVSLRLIRERYGDDCFVLAVANR